MIWSPASLPSSNTSTLTHLPGTRWCYWAADCQYTILLLNCVDLTLPCVLYHQALYCADYFGVENCKLCNTESDLMWLVLCWTNFVFKPQICSTVKYFSDVIIWLLALVVIFFMHLLTISWKLMIPKWLGDPKATQSWHAADFAFHW